MMARYRSRLREKSWNLWLSSATTKRMPTTISRPARAHSSDLAVETGPFPAASSLRAK